MLNLALLGSAFSFSTFQFVQYSSFRKQRKDTGFTILFHYITYRYYTYTRIEKAYLEYCIMGYSVSHFSISC